MEFNDFFMFSITATLWPGALAAAKRTLNGRGKKVHGYRYSKYACSGDACTFCLYGTWVVLAMLLLFYRVSRRFNSTDKSLILSASIKSFSDKPPASCVVNSMRNVR